MDIDDVNKGLSRSNGTSIKEICAKTKLSDKKVRNSISSFIKDDLVNYNESVWQCLQTVTVVAPSEGANFTIFLTGGGAIGDLGTLNTTDKTSAVGAINENYDSINSKIQISSFTATVDTTTNIVHNLTYDSLKDDLLVVFNGLLLDVLSNYTENIVTISIDLNGWSINTSDVIYFKLYKNVK